MPKLSLIIPVYNEADHLQKFLEDLDSRDFCCEVEFVIIDDCSTDQSWGIIDGFAFQRQVTKVRQQQNGGKGSAIHTGIARASGDFIAVQDADFEYDPSDLNTLVEPLIANKCEVVYGSRFHKSKNQVHRTAHYLVNRTLTLLSNALSGLYLTDMETCYKVFRSEVLKNIHLESQRFGFEPEITAKIADLNLRIQEFPISYYPRNYLEGKKITWKDGIAALWFILKYNVIDNITKRQARYKEGMPSHFIPAGRQWL